jgi:hypothetical protein
VICAWAAWLILVLLCLSQLMVGSRLALRSAWVVIMSAAFPAFLFLEEAKKVRRRITWLGNIRNSVAVARTI